MKILVLFDSVNETLMMEEALEEKGVTFRSVVKPRSLGTDCGVAIKVEENDSTQVDRIAEEQGCHVRGFFRKENSHWVAVEATKDQG